MKLYTVDCPKCLILEKKLQRRNVNFEKVYDFDRDEMYRKGFATAPILETDDGELLDFSSANSYINNI